MRTLSCGMWDLVPWLGIKPRPPVFGVQNLSHWITKQVSVCVLDMNRITKLTLIFSKISMANTKPTHPWPKFRHWHVSKWKVKVKVTQLCPTLCNPMGYTVHGILQARILEWVDFPFSRGSSQPREQTQVSHIAGGFFFFFCRWILDQLSHQGIPFYKKTLFILFCVPVGYFLFLSWSEPRLTLQGLKTCHCIQSVQHVNTFSSK